MNFLERPSSMILKSSLMPLALSTKEDNLLEGYPAHETPLIPLGDRPFSSSFKVVLFSSLSFLERSFKIRGIIITPIFSMLDRWSDLDALRMNLSNLQKMIDLLQVQATELQVAINLRLDPLSHQVDELLQRYDEADS
jgi:hypothetical protein